MTGLLRRSAAGRGIGWGFPPRRAVAPLTLAAVWLVVASAAAEGPKEIERVEAVVQSYQTGALEDFFDDGRFALYDAVTLRVAAPEAMAGQTIRVYLAAGTVAEHAPLRKCGERFRFDFDRRLAKADQLFRGALANLERIKPTAFAQAEPAEVAIPPESLPGSRRAAPQGEWQPTILPPNDLSDPPQRYKRCVGGACFGMSSLVYSLWLSPQQEGAMTVEDTAARVIHNLAAEPDGRFENHPLPTHVALEGVAVPLESREALVAVAEEVQNAIQPGGGTKKTPEVVREVYEQVRNDPHRIHSLQGLKRRLESRGGRAVMGLVSFDANLTSLEGHAAVLNLGSDGRIYVWDPNARMEDDAPGSGRLVPLRPIADGRGQLRGIQYEIELPSGEKQRRTFSHVLPSESFVTPERLPPYPTRVFRIEKP